MKQAHDSRQLSVPVLCMLSGLLVVYASLVEAAVYPGNILFKQTNTLIIERNDVAWAGVPEDYPYLRFGTIMSSLDGSRIFFNAACEYCPAEGYVNRPFVADAMGGNIRDVSEIFPPDLTNSWSGWGNMRINDDGNRVYIRAQGDNGKSLYYMDLTTNQVKKSVSDDFSSTGFDWFTINRDGSRLYLGKYQESWNDGKGLYYANLEGGRIWYLDVNDLPCTDQCGNMNLMAYMGSSFSDDHTFFKWDAGQDREALWHTRLDGVFTRLTPEEHYFVDTNTWAEWGPIGWRGISSENGETVLYAYKHVSGDPLDLVAVNRATQAEELLTWTTSLNGYDEYFITPSGDYAFVRGTMGDAGGLHYHTLFDLSTETVSTRDSWSYYLERVRSMSNLVQDRYYYVTYADAIYRIDTQADVSGDFSRAPNIGNISFSGPVLWDDENSQLGITVKVSDQQGLDNIEKVRLAVLVEGMEHTYWAMGREPLAFPTGDPGSVLLSDDGSHGDEVAGDGIFTFDAIATRKDGREEGGFNTWYLHYALPNDVGIRIIAYDLDGNSTIADTFLTIADCSQAQQTIDEDVTGELIVCAGDQITLSGIAVKPAAALHLNAPNVIIGLNTRVESGALMTVGAK